MAGIEIAPEHPAFSGFIFKIQANMDPKHRDRIAFVRVCSGKFERDMTVHHSRSEKKVRLSSSHKLFGNERETVDEAWPGDVIGLVGHDSFGIGDTLTTDRKLQGNPALHAGGLRYLHNPNTAKFKQFRRGLDQLMQEGVIQALYLRNSSIKTRCSPPSARCNSRSCNSGSKANTARVAPRIRAVDGRALAADGHERRRT
jgi:peptide chain release factor 3